MKKRVSVIIPTLNEEENIGPCLKGLLQQTMKPFEVIVVDNGSSDKTVDIVRDFKRRYKGLNVRLYLHPKGNIADVRGIGVKKAKGELIGSLDADAIPEKDWIKTILRCLENKKIAGAFGNFSYRNKGFFLNTTYMLSDPVRDWLKINSFLRGGNCCFRRADFMKVKGYSGISSFRKKKSIKYVKDDLYISKKLEKLGKIKYCPKLRVTLLHRVRDKKGFSRGSRPLDVLNRWIIENVEHSKSNRYFKEKQNRKTPK